MTTQTAQTAQEMDGPNATLTRDRQTGRASPSWCGTRAATP